MIISWLGHSCFRLQEKIDGKDVTVIIDPFKPEYTGLKLPSNLTADIVVVTHQHEDHNFSQAIGGSPFIIDMAGEYEVSGVAIDGVDSHHDEKHGSERGGNVIYRIEMGGLVVTHLGDLGTLLEEKQLERLAGTDILLVPVGGQVTLDAKKAVDVINQIDPKMVIPMHYSLPGLKFELGPVADFVKAIGLPPVEDSRLKVNRRDLDSENTQLIILSVS
ncbi:MAG TPA: MBL fold metallo-hydrolase [bacterium]|mgnify:FL=1|nr:MBL fold metallo-hydrolase [bacterium]